LSAPSGTVDFGETAFAAMQAVPAAPTTALPDVPGLSRVQFEGFDAVRLDAPQGTAVISLFGGHLLSYVPHGGQEVLWLSPLTPRPNAPVRGGVPVLWPYFARQGQRADLPAHGLVRTLRWRVVSAERAEDGALSVVMAPPALPGLGLSLRMTVRVGRSLEQSLLTTNTGTGMVRFTEALHTYYRVGDALQARAQGLDGAAYREKSEGFAIAHRQRGDWSLADSGGQADRLYSGTGGDYVLVDPVLHRRIRLRTEGSNSLVAWNPGVAAETRSPEIGPGWRHYVCLEAANAGADVVTLAAGAQHRLVQRISVEPL
jgi:glucose-6-phosphate 1-epimerase